MPVLDSRAGDVATAPATFTGEDLEERDGIEAKTVILRPGDLRGTTRPLLDWLGGRSRRPRRGGRVVC